MPKFLDEPDIRSLRPQRGSQATPEADAISGLAGIVDFIGGQVGKKRKQEAVIAKGEAIGEATTSILNLKDERANLLAEEADVTGQIANIYSDDLVTEEEKITLDNLSGQKAKLDKARKSGMLNETAYNTRYNAMWKQSLSNVGNLALQPEINSIFGSGIATFQEPVDSQDAQVNKYLDNVHGVGNHGIQERGEFLGNQAFVQQKTAQGAASVTKLQGSISNISSALNSTHVKALLTSVKKGGGVMTDVAKNNYLLVAQSSLSDMEGIYNQRVAEARSRGERLDSSVLTKMKEDIDEERKYYLETIPNQMETFGAGEQVSKALKIKQDLIELNRPMSASANAAFSSGGSSGVGGQITAEKMLDPAFVRNLESLQTGLPIEMMQQAAVDQLVWQFTGDVSVADMVDKGLVNPELLVLTGSMAIDNATVTDGASFDAMLTEVDKYRAGINLEDTIKFTESINSFGDKARQVSVAAKGKNGSEAAAKGQVGQVLRAQLKRVVEDSRFKNLTISLDENGLPVSNQDKLQPSSAAATAIRYGDIASLAGRGVAGGDRTKLQQPSKNTAEGEIAALVKAYTEYAKFGLADIRDLQELVTIEGPAAPQAQQRREDGDMTRVDGTKKSAQGWLGPIQNNVDGGTMTEVSVEFDDVLGGAPIPMLVPTLTKKEIETLSNMQIEGNAGKIPQSIKMKAIKHALERDKKGLSPFFSGDEEQPDVSGLEDGVYEDDQGNQFTVIGGAIQ